MGGCGVDAGENEDFFESKVRPLLSERCFECHSEEKQKGGLRLDSREAILQGGESGPAMIPGDPAQSLLIAAVHYDDSDLQMPPKEKLGKRAVQDLEQWIAAGAVWPGGEKKATGAQAEAAFEITDQHRAYWAFQPVPEQTAVSLDEIVDATLNDLGLQANPKASPQVLMRRASFDLIGFPPTFEVVQAFANDTDPNAFSKLVDRLLAMPDYGERWGRHWLDVVRYAQSNGYERDDEKPNSWRYRDYVIDSFNADKPYDRFILEQLAGDELPDGGDAGLIATGFYRLGVHDDEPDDKRAAEFDALDDMLKATTETFLGLTAGCARCHDHMFDPVSQRDYYELLAFFRNVQPYPAGTRDIAGGGQALAVSEHGANPIETHVLIRGNAGRPAAKVEPRFPDILGGTATLPVVSAKASSTGLRQSLAQWIARPEHPLTARVMANRVWQYHFGRGIVATPNDFGKAGEPPTNIALLDWLAAEFIKGGWSVKHLHRVIMNSKTYQRASSGNLASEAIDPDNRFLWRQNLRRLEAESIRDAMLAASGVLNPKRGGDRGFYPAVSGEVVAGGSRPGRGWGWSAPDEQNRRSVYAFVKRTMVYPFFEIFDYANTEGSLGARPTTTVAPQALLMLNGEFIAKSAAHVAANAHCEDDPVAAVFRATLSRNPTDQERTMAADYLRQQTAHYQAGDDQLTFSPDYSPALFTEYHDALPPDRYVTGPADGNWSYFKGSWGDVYESITNNDTERPPFALWNPEGNDFTINGHITLSNGTTRASLFLRAAADNQIATGYEILIDAASGNIAIREHRKEEILTLAEAASTVTRVLPIDFQVSAKGETVVARIGTVEVQAESDTAPSGRFGISASGGSVELRSIAMEVDGKSVALIEPDPERPGQRAFQDFCALLFNLNEFVYVD
ncbi:MAG: PSD1 and planctomycete cytochrome C domain-containing protein [Verrucomicrobia bacterium]|nr:PSD1 and planctomycete cytochrome C domain-containing protein [Verrucomicrobiota bacterium]